MALRTGKPLIRRNIPPKDVPLHPGQYVRGSILAPRKLSVVAAAKLVGVGRPALSNFLNGKVAATPEMASRIEVAFGIPAQRLLDLQAAYDSFQSKAKGAPPNAMPYVVPFLNIRAAELEAWVTRNISARTRLSVLLRTLVNSTSDSISRIDFPGNDDAERPGWDGYVETTQPTPWLPQGASGWEFGTNQDVAGKADDDYAKNVKAIRKADRDAITFVFVTPRHWPGKAGWIKDMNAKKQWRDVRAYDSSDLEQWLEQSIAAQAWFANEVRRSSSGVRSLDRCWHDWANVTEPPLASSLFIPAVESAKRKIEARIAQKPDKPIVVAADSTEEGLAFLAQLFGPAGGEELHRLRDRVLVFDTPGVLPRLAQGTKAFIAVATTREVERELGPLAGGINTIVLYPRNAANASPDASLEPLNYEAFRKSLEEMGYGRDDVAKYANESGRSLTVLRRRMATVPAIKTPWWAVDHKTATTLIPFLLTGSWSSTNAVDQDALKLLARADSYEQPEKECQRLATLDDPPVWSIGTYRGVISKIDLLFAIAGAITSQDLQRYFDVAKQILGEDDPSLDLPEGERWAASLHGKSRQFSTALREGVSETLVLLAAHGNHLFKSRVGFDCEIATARFVRDLLTPLKTRILEANDRDLSAYAEAAPEEFLAILEEDLATPSPETYGLMRPVTSDMFAACPRTGLLWALEGLAWNPSTLPRVALILAQLAEIEIQDNWVNKPGHSLESIFRAWMPQTAADQEARLAVMNLLSDKFPEVAWKICIGQLEQGQQIGDYSHKPKWRNDGYGYGEPLKTWEPILAFVEAVTEMVLHWKGEYTCAMLCDLVERLHALTEKHQDGVWTLVRHWASTASDREKAVLREKIRVTVMSRRGLKRGTRGNFAKLSADARESYKALEPSDLLSKHEWLFRQHWVEESADELHEAERDYHKREERIAQLRTNALREILEARGIPGVLQLAELGQAASQIGWIAGKELIAQSDLPRFLLAALPNPSESEAWAKKNLIIGALAAIQDEAARVAILIKLKEEVPESDFARFLLLAPFRRSTWQLVEKSTGPYRDKYWNEVDPAWVREGGGENEEAVERLLAAKRPRAAFACIRYDLDAIQPELLFRLMSEMLSEGKDQPGQYQLEQHYIEEAFERMDRSPALTIEQKAGLELAYIDALSQRWGRGKGYGIPNLEKYVEAHSELFVQAVVWTYRRSGEGEDPPELRVPPDRAKQLAERGYRLLEGLSRLPGHDDVGVLRTEKLIAWVKSVREACRNLGRLQVADLCLGKLLSAAPMGDDGVWPLEAVRQVMEEVHSKDLMAGAHTGLYNSRGVTWRGEGGAQERELADKYRAWANALQYSYPFVASELLMGMVKTYEHEAEREDTEASVRRRLH